jgi:hypothetical protein
MIGIILEAVLASLPPLRSRPCNPMGASLLSSSLVFGIFIDINALLSI